jgi:antirestriction protein ArdC
MSDGIDKIYSMITEKVIAALDKGTVPWRQTWRGGSGKAPASLKSKKTYRGINVFVLAMQQVTLGYQSRFWLTFKQAKDLKGSVKKGEKGTPVIFWKLLRKEDKDSTTGETTKRTIPLLRYYTVFNVDQCEGIVDPEAATAPEGITFNPIARCEELVKHYNKAPSIQHVEQRAWYRPTTDLVNMPKQDTFCTVEAYYSTLFHELAHSTGHKSRLDRDGIKSVGFGTELYSKEELVAEMGAAMLCGICGIDNAALIDNAASYIAHWRSKLAADPKLLICAAANAQKAADHIQGIKFSDKADDSEED